MHYTGSCSDIFKAAAEECDGLPLRPTPVIPGQTHNKHTTTKEKNNCGKHTKIINNV